MQRFADKRTEVCSIASKLVNIKIHRENSDSVPGESNIVGFECDSQTRNCETRCTYRLLLEDF